MAVTMLLRSQFARRTESVGYTGGMTSTQADAGPITFVNVFELDPEQVDEFMEGWKERAELMRKQPGFRSFRLHRALSPDASYQLVNVAVWDSLDAVRAATAQPEFQAMIQEAGATFDVVAHPGVYTTIIEAVAD
jgi:heme-degrading monooxygenase HmoA